MGGNGFYSRPSSSFGYWRGTGSDGPFATGQGSGMGAKAQGIGAFMQGQGPVGGMGWEPTILYLFVLILAEMFVFGFISKTLR